MTTPTPLSLHHMAITVSDVEASAAWYTAVFGIAHMMDAPHEGGFGRILADPEFRFFIALHHHEGNDRALFSERATGLDHVGFAVTTRSDLEAWQEHLEAHGVVRADVADKPLTQSPIADEPYASVLVFRDPDNIQLELFASAVTRGPVPEH